MRAIREAVGEEVDIMIDCHGRHSPATAIEFRACSRRIGRILSKSPCRRRTWTPWSKSGAPAPFPSPLARGLSPVFSFAN